MNEVVVDLLLDLQDNSIEILEQMVAEYAGFSNFNKKQVSHPSGVSFDDYLLHY